MPTLMQYAWVSIRSPGIYIFVKDAIDRIDPGPLAALRRKAYGICIDYIDRPYQYVRSDSSDVHIAASYAGLLSLQKRVGAGSRARLLLHNVDLRANEIRCEPQGELKLIYFGAPRNVMLSSRAKKQVDVINSECSEQIAESFRKLAGYNGHYCVRMRNQVEESLAVHKPFTKGFIAATLGCPVLVNQQVEDALHFLGADYPFLVPDTTDDAIDAGLDRMASAFDGATWKRALDVMRSIRARVEPASIARDLKAILDEIG